MRALAAALSVSLSLVACGPFQDEVNQAQLDEAAAEEGALRTASGLVFRELTAGSAVRPTGTDVVDVGYVGRFMDGEVFEATAQGQTVRFGLNQVISCWTEGLQLMGEGSVARLTCPPQLAYGASGSGPIPGNTVIQFDVTLSNVVGR